MVDVADIEPMKKKLRKSKCHYRYYTPENDAYRYLQRLYNHYLRKRIYAKIQDDADDLH